MPVAASVGASISCTSGWNSGGEIGALSGSGSCTASPPPLGLRRGLPRLDLIERVPQALGLVADEVGVVVAHAQVELGVDLVVPELEPEHELIEPGQQGHEAL